MKESMIPTLAVNSHINKKLNKIRILEICTMRLCFRWFLDKVAGLLIIQSSVFNSFHIRLKYVLNSGAFRLFNGVSSSKSKIRGMVCLMVAGLLVRMITLSAREMASDKS